MFLERLITNEMTGFNYVMMWEVTTCCITWPFGSVFTSLLFISSIYSVAPSRENSGPTRFMSKPLAGYLEPEAALCNCGYVY